MDDKINEILDGLPPKPPRSRLEPYATLIEEMRRRGWTYREISRVLADARQVRSSPSNIYYFLRLRARKARQARAQGGKAQVPKQAGAERFGAGNLVSTHTIGENAEPTDNRLPDIAERIAALKNRRAPPPIATGFAFDPGEPLRLTGPEKNGSSE